MMEREIFEAGTNQYVTNLIRSMCGSVQVVCDDTVLGEADYNGKDMTRIILGDTDFHDKWLDTELEWVIFDGEGRELYRERVGETHAVIRADDHIIIPPFEHREISE